MDKPKVVAIVGSTASGKSSLAIALAKQFNGEVVSCDSRQVYRKLDIGTAKVTQTEMDGVPHHLIDIVDLDTVYTAAEFVRDAAAAIDGIVNRGPCPIIAGGTFFWLELLQGTMQAAPVAPNPELREALEQLSNTELLDRLANHDPEHAEQIDQHNRRRLIRAIEVCEALGSVPKVAAKPARYNLLTIGLKVDKETLRERFKERALSWLQDGFRAEVEQLLASGVTRARLQEIGFEYTLMLSLIDGKISKDDFVQKFIEKNWQYAKRQRTWLKRDNSIEWYTREDSEAIFTRVAKFLS